MIYDRWHHLLSRYNYNLLSLQKLLQKDPNYQEKTSTTSVTPCSFKTPASTNFVDFDATSVSYLISVRSRHVTKSNDVV